MWGINFGVLFDDEVLVGESVIPILHNLEQISSDEHVGSLAENLLEALKENPQVAEKVDIMPIQIL